MGYTVEKSFDYANMCVDFEKKKVSLSYHYKSSLVIDFIIFFLFGLFIMLPAGGALGAFLVWLFPGYAWGYVSFPTAIIVWLIICYKTKYVRESLIKGCQEKDYNQVYIEGPARGKKIVLRNVGNYFTEYELYGDYKKFIKKFEIKNKKRIKKKKSLKMMFNGPE